MTSAPKTGQVKYVLFDLGGVLFHMNGYDPILRLLGKALSREQLHNLWVASEAVRTFETGCCDLDRFAELLVPELEFAVSPATFATEFCTFQGEEMEGASQLLSELKETVALGCLSNTNPPHVATMKAASDLFDLFDQCFLSYQIGLIKPDPACFGHVLKFVALAGSEIVFLDDSETNVEAARACGLIAERVSSPAEARSALSELGINV